MIVKIYNSAGKQVSEIPLSVLHEDGWSLSEFIDFQATMGRTCRPVDYLTEEDYAPANEQSAQDS